MRAWWCGFTLGVIWLQQQAALPGRGGWCALVSLGCAGLLVAVWSLRGHSSIGHGDECGESHWSLRRLRACAGWSALWCAAMCAGFGFAAWRAEMRLAASLPLAWEGRDVDVTGSIEGLPARDDRGVRFLFNVESVAALAVGADSPARSPARVSFPRVIQLSWIADEAPPPPLEPGERWRLRVRLKRPHGNANFGVRDAEAALLARNVRATGYVSAATGAARLQGNARGAGVTVDRWRAALRARIDTVLAGAPHRGIVVALAIGAQDEVSAADWQLMRATGTSHLVAISGLHIGFAAGLAAWFAGAVWRRSGWIGRNWPLWLPAPFVAVTCGALFAALHAALAGFNVPVQRALWMAGVVALAYLSGRNLARSAVLAWALGLVLLIDPWAVVSAGFWLSFCAVAAILFATSGRPRVRNHERNTHEIDDAGGAPSRAARLRAELSRRVRAFGARLRSALHVQLAVTIALAPLTVYWFAQIPVIGPLANAFAIPWVSLLVTPSVLAGVVLPAPLDAWMFQIAHALLGVMVAGLQSMSGPRWVLWWLPQPDAWTLAAAAAGVLWCLAPRGWPLRWAAPLTWLPLLAPASPGPPHGSFRLTALDVGQGTSVLVETQHHVLLFDTGPGPESTHAGERVVVPFLRSHGVNALDTLIVSHADSDHSGGAPAVLDAIEVRQMVAALPPANALWASARQRGAQALPCAAGQRWQWDGVEFAMLWPDAGPLQGKPNAHCCVLRVSSTAGVGSGSARRGETGGESGNNLGGESGGDSGNKSGGELGGDSGGESSNKSRGDPQSQSGSDSRNRSASGADNEQGSDSPRAASGATGNEARVRPQGTPLAALLTADIEAPVERILLSRDREMLRAQVLVVPHHGSKTSSTEPFLDSIDPLVALFQVGYRNRFHHPSAGVLARYSARQIELGRSDADGAVRVEIDPDFAARRGPRAPAAALTIERYRDTHRRYWMDR